MLTALAISLLISFCTLAGWRHVCVCLNRRKALGTLRSLEEVLGKNGHLNGFFSSSPSQFRFPVRLASSTFRNPCFHLELAPRELPLNWLLWRREGQETLTFQADLDCAPRFNLRVLKQQSFARSHRGLELNAGQWNFHHLNPFLITTRDDDWQHETAKIIASVLNLQEQDLLSVEFRRSTPHFSASFPVALLQARTQPNPGFFEALRELATEASNSHS